MTMTAASSHTASANAPGARPGGAAACGAVPAASTHAQAQAARARLADRVRDLQALFDHIAATRMAGVALLHDELRVQAIGFELDRPISPAATATASAMVGPARPPTDGLINCDPATSAPPGPAAPAEPAGGVGILITPWFMNLVWLPLDSAAPTVRVSDKRTRVVGNERFDFIGAHEPGFGGYEACSLFSPMFEFVDHGAAVATAFEVLKQLRADKPTAKDHDARNCEAGNWGSIMSTGEAAQAGDGEAPTSTGSPAEPVPSRRALLFGRTTNRASKA